MHPSPSLHLYHLPPHLLQLPGAPLFNPPFFFTTRTSYQGFPDDLPGKKSTHNAGDIGDVGLIPGSWRTHGVGNGTPLQYSCLEHPMDRGAWWATVGGITRVGHHCNDWTRIHQEWLRHTLPALAYWIPLAARAAGSQHRSSHFTAHSLKLHAFCLVTKSCLTLCSYMNCSPPGFSVHGISLSMGFPRQEYWSGL